MDKEVHAKKQARNVILDALNMTYPNAMRMASLNRCVLGLIPAYDIGLLEKDVYYLKAKGYLEAPNEEVDRMLALKKRFVKLTAAGKEIADDIINDPAIEI